MRDSNHRTISTNKPVVTITSTIYDRRALDIHSIVPLINSLNHLAYLTSNSSKVCETVAVDGALERLVSILRHCHLSTFDLLDEDLKFISSHDRIRQLYKEKKLALCAWKWTLTFQCLVLTGTRGTEQIRKKVVNSGILPVLVTLLDNYLLYHKNFDFMKNEPLNFDFKNITSEKMHKYLKKDENETYKEYLEYLLGNDNSTLSNDHDFLSEELLTSSMTRPSDFGDIWSSSELIEKLGVHDNIDSVIEDVDSDNDLSQSFSYQSNEKKPIISAPREFFLGKIIPKQDDVIWSLQLLAFVSKYTYMKQPLQTVELVESLSFRRIIQRAKQRLEPGPLDEEIDVAVKSSSAALSQPNTYIENLKPRASSDTPMINLKKIPKASSIKNDPFLKELQALANTCHESEQSEIQKSICPTINMFDRYRIRRNNNHNTNKDRRSMEKQFVENFEQKWNYESISKNISSEKSSNPILTNPINVFPLVEKYTVSNENPHDSVYWSSVIMRNSCRKDEILGVRQCANFACGKWEEYPRQFAKCRRCKRTKYCCRKCQLKAWAYHRHWCHEVGPNSIKSTTTPTALNTPHDATSLSEATSDGITEASAPPTNYTATISTPATES